MLTRANDLADKVPPGVGGTGHQTGRRSQQPRAVGRRLPYHQAQVLSPLQRAAGVQRHDPGLPEPGQPRRSRRSGKRENFHNSTVPTGIEDKIRNVPFRIKSVFQRNIFIYLFICT